MVFGVIARCGRVDENIYPVALVIRQDEFIGKHDTASADCRSGKDICPFYPCYKEDCSHNNEQDESSAVIGLEHDEHKGQKRNRDGKRNIL